MKPLCMGLLTALLFASATHAEPAESRQAVVPDRTVPSTDPHRPAVAQSGPQFEAIRRQLQKIRLPEGFSIELFALVPGARHMAVAPASPMLFVGTRESTVWAVTDHDRDGVADEVRAFAPSLKFELPNGVCWTPEGDLVVVELNRVLRFAAAQTAYAQPEVAVHTVVPHGQLVPAAFASPIHGARTCRVGPDHQLYITLGQPYNVQPAGLVEVFNRLGIGGIVRMDLSGQHREVWAIGARNSVGQDFNPRDGTLWWTDNQTDGMGNDIPPGELNRSTKPGEHFGYPYWGGHVKVAGSAVARDLRDMAPPANAVFPQLELPAHQAQLGMVFYRGTQFPARYRGGIFMAAHGSWNRQPPSGALVQFVPVHADGSAGPLETFAEGWLDARTGRYSGRPVDVAVMPDGALLISDDHAGAIYRVRYRGR